MLLLPAALKRRNGAGPLRYADGMDAYGSHRSLLALALALSTTAAGALSPGQIQAGTASPALTDPKVREYLENYQVIEGGKAYNFIAFTEPVRYLARGQNDPASIQRYIEAGRIYYNQYAPNAEMSLYFKYMPDPRAYLGNPPTQAQLTNYMTMTKVLQQQIPAAEQAAAKAAMAKQIATQGKGPDLENPTAQISITPLPPLPGQASSQQQGGSPPGATLTVRPAEVTLLNGQLRDFAPAGNASGVSKATATPATTAGLSNTSLTTIDPQGTTTVVPGRVATSEAAADPSVGLPKLVQIGPLVRAGEVRLEISGPAGKQHVIIARGQQQALVTIGSIGVKVRDMIAKRYRDEDWKPLAMPKGEALSRTVWKDGRISVPDQALEALGCQIIPAGTAINVLCGEETITSRRPTSKPSVEGTSR